MKSAVSSKKTPTEPVSAAGPIKLALGELGQLAQGDVVAFVCADERPLSGLLGLWDWRLCGRLSRLILEKHLQGAVGENLLTYITEPSGTGCRLFICGLGNSGSLDQDKVTARLAEIKEMLRQAGSTKYKVLLPESRKKEALSKWVAQAFADASLYHA